MSESTTSSSENNSRGFGSKSFIIIIGFAVILLIALGSAGYFYMQYQKSQAQLASPTAAADKEAQSLVDEVGKLIVLPSNETPTIATVSDVNKLKEQSFFAQAKNGDKVLIYTKAQKAILYDPTQKKVIEVGPINVAQTTPTVAASAGSPTPGVVKVALYNGTLTTGLTSTVEKQLKTALPTVSVVDKSNAQKNTYTKTVVVDLTGTKAAAAAQLAKTLNGSVGALPAGEVKPTGADIAVILGK